MFLRFSIQTVSKMEHVVIGKHAHPRFASSLRIDRINRSGALVQHIESFKFNRHATIHQRLRNRGIEQKFVLVHHGRGITTTAVHASFQFESRFPRANSVLPGDAVSIVEGIDRLLLSMVSPSSTPCYGPLQRQFGGSAE